jgi:hypothetical protein
LEVGNQNSDLSSEVGSQNNDLSLEVGNQNNYLSNDLSNSFHSDDGCYKLISFDGLYS